MFFGYIEVGLFYYICIGRQMGRGFQCLLLSARTLFHQRKPETASLYFLLGADHAYYLGSLILSDQLKELWKYVSPYFSGPVK